MKKIYVLVSSFMLTVAAYSQAPEKISYQSLIRDTDQDLIVNQPVGMRITILEGSSPGTVIIRKVTHLRPTVTD